MNKSRVIVLLCLLLVSIAAQNHTNMQLDKPYEESLSQETKFTGRYIFDITESKVNALKNDKWFFFVEVEPQVDKEWISTIIELSSGKKDQEISKNIKTCQARKGGVDSCFLTNKQFNYTTESIHVRVICRGPCKFKISGQITAPYKLKPGQNIKMDFESTAYSKIFVLDTSNSTESFDQLRIILRPDGFLKFPAPIEMYVNQDESVPSKQRHDLKGITLWDNGQGIFLEQPDAKGIFTILISGPEKNVLILQTQLVSFKKTNDLTSNLPYFDYLGMGVSKYYKAKVDPTKGTCLQLTTFSGGLKLAGIYDANLQQIKQQFPALFRSFSELQYQIPASFFKQNKQEYAIDSFIVYKIEGVKESTFVLESYDLNLGITHLNPEMNRYVQISSEQYNQYYIDLVELDVPEFKKTEIEIILTTEEDKKLDVRFFNCKKEHGKECGLKTNEVKSKDLNNQQRKQISSTITQHLLEGVTIYKFILNAKQFKKIGNDTERYILTVLIVNNEKQDQLYTIQYINIGKNIYLREGEVKTERVAQDESKYYVFTNTNDEVKQIRIHVMEISGRVFIQGYKEDPRVKNVDGKQISDFRNAIRYNDVKVNDTIYLKVTGKQMAYYSVQLQLIKESERHWWNRTHQNKSKGYNQIILVQNIPYEFNIEPNERVVYQIHTKSSQFKLQMSSLLPLELCMTEELTKPPFPPNCQEKTKLTEEVKNLVMDVKMERGKIGNIGVQNKNDKAVKFNIKFSATNKNIPIPPPANDTKNGTTPAPVPVPSDVKCLPGLMGKITKYNFKKDSASCYNYQMSKMDDLEVVINVVSSEYEAVNTLVEINNLQKIEVIGTTHVFKKAEIMKTCGNVDVCPLRIYITSSVQTQIRFTAQYMSQTVFLLDGISNTFSGRSSRKFVYELYNKVNTTVILQNKNGYYKFYGKIVESADYWADKSTFPTSSDKLLASSNPFYYVYQISVISQQQIQKTKCKECLLLLLVQKEKDNFQEERSKFVIECTQQDKFIKENAPIASYLGRRSFAFYQFYNSNNGTILVTVNSQNQQCAQLYMKKGNGRASGSQYDKKSLKNSLIFEKAEIGNYAITLQAIEDCHYTIDVTTSANNLYTSIEQGLYKDITLAADSTTKFIFHNEINQTFKILALHQNGQLSITVKSYPTIKQLLADNAKKMKFNWAGKDFLRIDKQSKYFCANCYYLIAIQAERQTKSSIMIPNKDSQFPIVMDSTMKDELKAGEIQKLRVFTDKLGQFQINVMKGKIKVTITNSFSSQGGFTGIFNESQGTQYKNISTIGGEKSQYGFIKFSKIDISAEQNSVFSFGLISDKDVTKRGNRIKLGNPQYVTLQPDMSQCFRGTFEIPEEEFLISISGDEQEKNMNQLEISCKINQKLLQLSKNIAKSQMMVTIENPPQNLPADYQFCMKSKGDLFITFIQSSKLNYFPEKSSIMVSKQINLTYYAQGKSLLQINECTSRAITTISPNFNLKNSVSSDIRQVRKSNNIIEFTYYGPVYIHVEAASATVSWRKKDQITGVGHGYDQYSSSKIRIDKASDYLKVQIFPLKQIQTSKPKINFGMVNYSAFIAEQEMNLMDAINCNNGVYLTDAIATNNLKDSITLRFQIGSILKTFQHKKYVLIGVLATAKSNLNDDGSYRFVYAYQQIPLEMLKTGNQGQVLPQPINQNKPKEENSGFGTFVGYLAIGLIVVVLAVLIYRKWIRSMLKHRRRQKLSEQGMGEVKYQQFTSYT